jgi:ketosteroid isomerase-like protein
MSQENVEVVLQLSEANARRDWDAIYAMYAPDIEWEDSSGLWGDWGVVKGQDALRQAWGRWFEVFGDVSWDLEEAPVDAGDDVVATYHVRGRGRESGVAADQRITLVWSVHCGKIVRVRAYRERAQALEAAGLRQ